MLFKYLKYLYSCFKNMSFAWFLPFLRFSMYIIIYSNQAFYTYDNFLSYSNVIIFEPLILYPFFVFILILALFSFLTYYSNFKWKLLPFIISFSAFKMRVIIFKNKMRIAIAAVFSYYFSNSPQI